MEARFRQSGYCGVNGVWTIVGLNIRDLLSQFLAEYGPFHVSLRHEKRQSSSGRAACLGPESDCRLLDTWSE